MLRPLQEIDERRVEVLEILLLATPVIGRVGEHRESRNDGGLVHVDEWTWTAVSWTGKV